MTNVYRIGVSLAMASNGPQVLGALARSLTGLHVQTNQLTGGFNRLKLAIGGAFAIAGGVAILSGMNKLISAGEKLSTEQGKMLAAGLSQKQVAEATAKAWDTSGKVMGTAVHENLAAISHLRAILGDLPDAYKLVGSYQRNSVALEGITGRPGEQQAFLAARSIHLAGSANDPITHKLNADAFAHQMNVATAMIAAGGGKLTANDLLLFQQQAGSFGTRLTEEGRINLVGMMQAQTGRKAGSQFTALNRALLAGVMPKAVMQEFVDMGILDASRIIPVKKGKHVDSGAVAGGNVHFANGALKGEELFKADPASWIYNVLRPTLVAKGLLTTGQQVDWVNKSKLGINASRFLAEGLSNQGVDQQEAANVRLAARNDQYASQMGRSMLLNKKALHEAFGNFVTALAMPLIPSAIKGLQVVTKGIQDLTSWAVAHPTAVAAIGKTLIAVGVGLTALGVAAVSVAVFATLATAGTIGLVVGGIAALVGVMGTLVVLNWNGIAKGFRLVYETLAFIAHHPIQFLTTPIKDLPAAIAADGVHHPGGGPAFTGWGARGIAGSFGGKSYAPGPANSNKPIEVTTHLHVDGKRMASVVSKHQAGALSGNNAATGRPDPSATLASPAAGYNR